MKDPQIEELRASRKRLVLAAAADRGRIERELHDGPQQRLVALAVELQQARRLVDVHPAAAGVLIDEMSGQLQEAVDALRALAHRIHPPLLEAGGLRAALRTTACSKSSGSLELQGSATAWGPALESSFAHTQTLPARVTSGFVDFYRALSREKGRRSI